MIGFNFWLVFAQSASFQRWLGTSVENLRRNLIRSGWIILFRALGNPHKSQFDAPCSPQAIGGTIYHTPRRQGETSEHRTFYWKMTHLAGFENVYTVWKIWSNDCEIIHAGTIFTPGSAQTMMLYPLKSGYGMHWRLFIFCCEHAWAGEGYRGVLVTSPVYSRKLSKLYSVSLQCQCNVALLSHLTWLH